MPISSVGVGSGLNAESIITQLMAVERQPLTKLQTQETGLKAKVSLFGKVQSLFSDLQSASKDLASAALWAQTTATSNSSAVGVVTGSGAVAGNYAVAVQQLANAQTATSTGFASSSSTLSSGTLTIDLGTRTGTPVSGFTAKTGSTPVVITIAAGQTSLAAVRDSINAAGAGVTASIITDASGARLSLRSTATGAENGFRITAIEDTDDGNPATGLSALGYNALAASPMSLNLAAQDARATINGIAITSASNTLAGVVDGMTLTLWATTTIDANVAVAADTEGARKAIDKFVSAFNGLASFLREQTKYDADSQTAGPLQGNRTAIGLQYQLRGVLNQASTASSLYATLSDVGIVMKSDGTLETKAAKLDAALANRGELRRLFATLGADNASTGFMVRFRNLADAALGTDGTLDTATTTLQGQIKNLGKREDALELRLLATEKRLRAQYEALDKRMAGLNSLSNYVTAQLAAWNKPVA